MAYSKFFLYKKQLSFDGGETWEDTDPLETTINGDPIATYDTLEECENSILADRYLTIIPRSDGAIKKIMNNDTFYYSTNSGTTWTSANTSTTISMTSGTPIYFKGTITPVQGYGVGEFSANTNYDVEGNPMSLLYGDDFIGETSLVGKDYAFNHLFSTGTTQGGGGNVVSAQNLALPATTLSRSCYSAMFMNCTILTTVPKNLLPATALTENCYAFMFSSCSSLTAAPDLLAPTLTSSCYESMFDGCSSLNSITCLATNPSNDQTYNNPYTLGWVHQISANGTFYKFSNANWATGDNGIPNGWTVIST
jgi:hypothetical protein